MKQDGELLSNVGEPVDQVGFCGGWLEVVSLL